MNTSMKIGKRLRCMIAAAAIATIGPRDLKPALAGSLDRPRIVVDIERAFGHFFLFTTNGGGTYVIYQQIEDPLGIPASGEVVCMLRECFLSIAEVPDAALVSKAPNHIGWIRARFRAVREAYTAMRRARPEVRAVAADIWRETAAQVGSCLENPDKC